MAFWVSFHTDVVGSPQADGLLNGGDDRAIGDSAVFVSVLRIIRVAVVVGKKNNVTGSGLQDGSAAR